MYARTFLTLVGLMLAIPAWAQTRPVNITWTAPTTGGPVVNYRIERRVCQAIACTDTATTFAEIGQPTGLAFSDATALVGTIYGYRGRASNADGFGPYTAVAAIQVVAAPNPPGPMGPLNLQLGAMSPPSVPALTLYVDPTQHTKMVCCKHSHYLQPVRAWSDTVPGTALLTGMGFNTTAWNWARTNLSINYRLFRDVGFATARQEADWGKFDYDNTLSAARRSQLFNIIQTMVAQGLRPLLLLNGHHGAPGPRQEFTRTLASPAPVGATTITLTDASGLIPHRSGLSNIEESYWAANIFVTAINGNTVTLSKPLPRALSGTVQMATLRFRPLSNVGTAEFEETVAGWIVYARTVMQVARDAGATSFDVEVWNEPTFGSHYVSINDYYKPGIVPNEPSPINQGGRWWELVNRTVQLAKAEFPEASVFNGFTNTCYLCIDVSKLPAGLAAISAHPYEGIHYTTNPGDEPGGMAQNLEGYAPPTPPYSVLMPETRSVFITPDSLSYLVYPPTKKSRIVATEHGLCAQGWGAPDPLTFQAKTVLRSALTFIHTGITPVWFFVDAEANPVNNNCYDMMPQAVFTLATYPSDPTTIMTPTLRAVQRLTQSVAGSVALASPRPITISTNVAGDPQIFPGDATHPPLLYRDVLAIYPWQITAKRFMVSAYVMSRDITKAFPESTVTIALDGIVGTGASVSVLDALTGATIPVEVLDATGARLVVRLLLSDSPRLITIQEA